MQLPNEKWLDIPFIEKGEGLYYVRLSGGIGSEFARFSMRIKAKSIAHLRIDSSYTNHVLSEHSIHHGRNPMIKAIEGDSVSVVYYFVGEMREVDL